MGASVRVLVVDDCEPWRLSVISLLQQEPKWQIVWQACDGLEAVEKSRELQPELILLDIGLPKLNGIEAARRIAAIVPDAIILFLSENRCPDVVQEALRVGGRGYVLKSDAAQELLAALEAVMTGRPFIGQRFQRKLDDRFPE